LLAVDAVMAATSEPVRGQLAALDRTEHRRRVNAVDPSSAPVDKGPPLTIFE
jgi:hypothetical protein